MAGRSAISEVEVRIHDEFGNGIIHIFIGDLKIRKVAALLHDFFLGFIDYFVLPDKTPLIQIPVGNV